MNITGADQPAHPRSLISAFVIRFLESYICKLASGEIKIIYLVFVAEETGLNLALSETPKTVFSRRGPFYVLQYYGNKTVTGKGLLNPLVLSGNIKYYLSHDM